MYRLTVRTSIPNTNGTICEFLQSQLWSVPYPWPSSFSWIFLLTCARFQIIWKPRNILESLKSTHKWYPVLGAYQSWVCAISSKRRLLNPHLYSHPTSGIQSEITLLSYSPSNPSRDDSFTLLHRFTNLEQMEPMSFVIYYQIYSFYNKCVSKL